jgi:hypothetical protein
MRLIKAPPDLAIPHPRERLSKYEMRVKATLTQIKVGAPGRC